MSFTFNKNDDPIDMSKGGDNPKLRDAQKRAPEKVIAPSEAAAIPARQLPAPPPSPLKPPVNNFKPISTPPALSTPPAKLPLAVPVKQEIPLPYRNSPTHQENIQRLPVAEPQQQYSQPVAESQQQAYEPQQQYSQPQQQYGQPVAEPQQQYGQPQSDPQQQYVSSQQEFSPKGKSSVFKATKNTKSQKKSSKPEPTAKKPGAFSGDRKKVLIARITIFSMLGILVFAGLGSFMPKSSGLSASDGPLIISKVKESLNVTDFPRTAGEGMAIGFTKTYLNYDSTTREQRITDLSSYAGLNILENIDIRPATEQEFAAARANTTNSAPVTGNGTQTVTDGPYLVDSVMLKGGEAAVFTTKSKINNGSWIYMQVPMFYDKTSGALSVSGSPVFVSPIGVAEVPSKEYEITWNGDQKAQDAISEDMFNYMKAWAASDDPNIQRFTKKDNKGKSVATLSALQGLNNSVQLVSVDNISVEAKPELKTDSSATEKTDFLLRQAQITVTWLEPNSGMIYTQTYYLQIEYLAGDWFVKDIKNVSSGINRDAVPAAAVTTK